MGKAKFIQYTYYNAMALKILIDDHEEVTVRDCPAIAFTQRLSKAIASHPDKAAIEKELATLSYEHCMDKWYALNCIKRRGISLIDKSSR